MRTNYFEWVNWWFFLWNFVKMISSFIKKFICLPLSNGWYVFGPQKIDPRKRRDCLYIFIIVCKGTTPVLITCIWKSKDSFDNEDKKLIRKIIAFYEKLQDGMSLVSCSPSHTTNFPTCYQMDPLSTFSGVWLQNFQWNQFPCYNLI